MTDYFSDGSVLFLEPQDVDADGRLVIDDTPTFVMIFGSFCGHCHKAAPEFQKLANAVKARGIVCAAVQVDASPDEQKLAQQMVPQMEGVPTFALYNNGKFMEIYDGPRTASDMARYLVKRT